MVVLLSSYTYCYFHLKKLSCFLNSIFLFSVLGKSKGNNRIVLVFHAVGGI